MLSHYQLENDRFAKKNWTGLPRSARYGQYGVSFDGSTEKPGVEVFIKRTVQIKLCTNNGRSVLAQVLEERFGSQLSKMVHRIILA